MVTAPVAERLIAAHSAMKRACDLLIAPTPQALDGCQAALERAVSSLRQWRSQDFGETPDASLRAAAHEMRSEVRRATRLLEGLDTFYSGWNRVLGTLSGGYTAGGDPAPVERHGRLCWRG